MVAPLLKMVETFVEFSGLALLCDSMQVRLYTLHVTACLFFFFLHTTITECMYKNAIFIDYQIIEILFQF